MLTSSVRLSFAYILSLLTIVSCLQEERSPEDILVPSPAQVECSESAFSLTSKVPSGSEKLVDECGFLVGTTKDLADAVTVEGTLNANTFAADLPSRKYGTTYHICSYVTNGHGSEIRSDLRSFALEPLDKYVKFGDVTVRSYDLASKTAELALTADIWAGVEVSEAGLCYGKSEVLSIEGDHAAGMLADDGAIYITIKGFVDGDKYCLRPYLMDGEYLTYGAVVEFSIPAVPVVRTNDAAEITSEGALLSGEVVKGADISERGFMLAEGESSAADMKQKKVVEGTIGEYTLALEGLLPNQKYTYCAYAVNPTGTYYGPVKSFTTKVGLPVVASVVASSITSTSATLSATVKSHGGETVSEVGFYYSTDEAVDIETATKVNQPYSEASFDLQANELAANTKYYVKAYAVNSAGVGYSQIVDFTTSAGAPSVTTLGATDVTSTGATLSGTVIADNGSAITERGFVWMQGTGTPTTDSFKLKVDGTTGDFTSTLTGLEPNQKYSFRAYAINSKGTSYGDVMTFTTGISLASLTSVTVSSITSTSATLSSKVSSHGGETVSEVGFYYSTDAAVDLGKSQKVNRTYSSDSFSISISELSINTKYYVKAYAVNSAGTVYSEIESFTTLASTPVVTTVGSSDVTSVSAVLSGKVVTDNGAAITERGFVWMQGTGTPTTDSFKLKVDGTTGEFTSTLTGLEPNQKFSFRAYAINSKGTSYGDVMTFATVAGLPTLSAMKVSDITTTSATFTCAVTGHGGDIVSEVGFYIGKEESVDIETALKISEAYTSDSFTLTATDLEVGTEYYVKAYTKNSVGESCSAIVPFKTVSTAPSVTTVGSSEVTDSSALLSGEVTDDNGEDITERGFVWLKGTGTPTTSDYKIQSDGTTGEFTAVITDIVPNQTYSFRAYAINAKGTSYGETMSFMIEIYPPTVTTVDVTDITDNSAVSGGVIVDDGGGDIIAKGVVWSRSKNPTVEDSFKTEDGNGVDSFTSYLTDLTSGRTYYVRAYATNLVGTSYGEELQFTVAGELQAIHLQAANCFIISSPKVYSFKTVKGNSSESVGSVSSAEVLWESYGTSQTPVVGSLVSSVSVQGDMIVFEVPEPYREGNAVIAAKDEAGTILWSWHIWLTDQPQEQIYNNNAGTMLDRNLGATSATPGDVGALGLLYQWGRKDPFLGYSSVTKTTVAKSTISWPSVVSTSSSVGTVDYTVANPTTYITAFSSPYDWLYSSGDNTLWQSGKTIYDPCPAGYRVPDGGGSGVWSIAHGSSSSYIGTFDSINRGFDFSGDFGEDATIWYPCAGYRTYNDGSWSVIGHYGHYWSVSPNDYGAYRLRFDYEGNVGPSFNDNRADGNSVRCLKEGTGGGPQYDNDISISGAISLSDAGTANSYIVSSTGTYSIPVVKGNSSESVGSVASAEVLWETFGTDEKISKGGLLSGARYENGKIYFKTADSYREGNAVIAAKDASGIILWSWHIWLTDEPEGQVYYNNAGTMMDRNLGATSATPGDVGALGLLYQWGRKDPFLGSSSISSNTVAKSTLTWPSAVSSDSLNGTIAYAVEHPTTFITPNSNNYDWYYTGSSSTDNTRWQFDKTIYDPCPSGWRVPDGGSNGVWKVTGFSDTTYDDTNEGISFSISSPSTTWYPASGYRYNYDWALYDVGNYGYYWSVTPDSSFAYLLYFSNYGDVYPSSNYYRAHGFSVRCLQESE